MRSMKLTLEESACVILQGLGRKFTGAQLDYETFAGVHNFTVDHEGTRFRVQFAEQMLLGRSTEELEDTIHKVAQYVLSNKIRPAQYSKTEDQLSVRRVSECLGH